jgi:FkbM family methyltransferase
MNRIRRAVLGSRPWGMLNVVRMALLTAEPLRFLRRERRKAEGPFAYRLRGTSRVVYLRHGTPDINTFQEVFLEGEYEPPAGAREAISQLPPLPSFVDLGANIGTFGLWADRVAPDAQIVSVEADPANAAVLRRAIAANAAEHRWKLIEACASTRTGTVRFSAGNFSVSRIADSDTEGTIEVPAVDAFDLITSADVVKIDIEGGEWPILTDPRFRDLTARVVVVEYHPDGCPGDPEGSARAALESAGLTVERTRVTPAWGSGVLWGWREG